MQETDLFQQAKRFVETTLSSTPSSSNGEIQESKLKTNPLSTIFQFCEELCKAVITMPLCEVYTNYCNYEEILYHIYLQEDAGSDNGACGKSVSI
jgi:hypothetical protein